MTNDVFDVSISEAAAVGKIAQSAIDIIRSRIESDGIFHLVLTGGVTGNLVSEALAREFNRHPDEFKGLHIWWGDERFLPNNNPERNDFALTANLDPDTKIHLHSVFSPDDVKDVETAARRYNMDLQGVQLGLVILGVGPDGHVASLFPGQWNKVETRNAISISDSPKPPPQRVSLSMAKINSAERVWLLTCGEKKREVVKKIQSHEPDLPVNHIQGIVETLIYADQDSFGQAERPLD